MKDFFSKYDQIRIFPRIWSHLLKKSLMKNFNFYAVQVNWYIRKKMNFYIIRAVFNLLSNKYYGSFLQKNIIDSSFELLSQ